MKTLQVCTPRQSVLDGTADFVVNLADLARLTEADARRVSRLNVLTSGMELLLQQAFSRMSGEKSASGIYKLSESMGGGKTQTMIVPGFLRATRHCAAKLASTARCPLPDPMSSLRSQADPRTRRFGSALGSNLVLTFPVTVRPRKHSGAMCSPIDRR